MESYFEENSFHPLFSVVASLTLLGVIVALSFVPSGEPSGYAIAIGTLTAVLLLFLNIPMLQTKVTSEKIQIRLGRIVPMWWKNVPISGIENVHLVDLGRRRWNLGAHLIRFRGHTAWAMLYGGTRAVYIEQKRGLPVLIGSEKPEALVAAIEREREKLTR